MRSAQDAAIGMVIAITGAGITGAATAGMVTAGTDIGIGVLAIAGTSGAMAIASASAADRR
jgi:hypothetical protein